MKKSLFNFLIFWVVMWLVFWGATKFAKADYHAPQIVFAADDGSTLNVHLSLLPLAIPTQHVFCDPLGKPLSTSVWTYRYSFRDYSGDSRVGYFAPFQDRVFYDVKVQGRDCVRLKYFLSLEDFQKQYVAEAKMVTNRLSLLFEQYALYQESLSEVVTFHDLAEIAKDGKRFVTGLFNDIGYAPSYEFVKNASLPFLSEQREQFEDFPFHHLQRIVTRVEQSEVFAMTHCQWNTMLELADEARRYHKGHTIFVENQAAMRNLFEKHHYAHVAHINTHDLRFREKVRKLVDEFDLRD